MHWSGIYTEHSYIMHVFFATHNDFFQTFISVGNLHRQKNVQPSAKKKRVKNANRENKQTPLPMALSAYILPR